MLVLLKRPANVKKVENSITSRVQGQDILRYWYDMVKVYEIDKHEVLTAGQVVLYPLRVFMRHEGESEEKHIQECLAVVEELEDKDYYFLTQECLKKP